MDTKYRALAGALSGAGGTLALSGLRVVLNRFGLVFDTAPVQVIDRIEELGLVGELSPGAHRALTATAHCAYGLGTGTVLGLLRRDTSQPAEELAVGSALGVLVWGAGWASWLPLTGVHSAPWTQSTPKVLLPILDHAVFGATWGLIHWAIHQKRG
ncbi:MAG TPA: hypothetical protein VFE21_01800 [Rubrobacteraceae bacterium]|nr:hypothetical protein [Rubrobacteraceae bacterium]